MENFIKLLNVEFKITNFYIFLNYMIYKIVFNYQEYKYKNLMKYYSKNLSENGIS